MAGAGKNAVSSQQGLGKKLLDGIDNLKSTGKALLKDEGGFLDLDALAGKKSVSGAVGKTSYGESSGNISELLENRQELTGTNREKLLSMVQDTKLAAYINEVYRPGASVGDGGIQENLD